MINKNSKRIFASLNKDGVGGDIVDMGYNFIKHPMVLDSSLWVYNYTNSKVIGIHK